MNWKLIKQLERMSRGGSKKALHFLNQLKSGLVGEDEVAAYVTRASRKGGLVAGERASIRADLWPKGKRLRLRDMATHLQSDDYQHMMAGMDDAAGHNHGRNMNKFWKDFHKNASAGVRLAMIKSAVGAGAIYPSIWGAHDTPAGFQRPTQRLLNMQEQQALHALNAAPPPLPSSNPTLTSQAAKPLVQVQGGTPVGQTAIPQLQVRGAKPQAGSAAARVSRAVAPIHAGQFPPPLTVQPGGVANTAAKGGKWFGRLGALGRFGGLGGKLVTHGIPVLGGLAMIGSGVGGIHNTVNQFANGNFSKGLAGAGSNLLNLGGGIAGLIPGLGWLPQIAAAAGAEGLNYFSKGASSQSGENVQRMLGAAALLGVPAAVGALAGGATSTAIPGSSFGEGARSGAYTAGGGAAGLLTSNLLAQLLDKNLGNAGYQPGYALPLSLAGMAAGGFAGNRFAAWQNRRERKKRELMEQLGSMV